MKVYLIQCDCCIQDVKVIHSEEEWKEYSKISPYRAGANRFPAGVPVCEGAAGEKEIRSLKALIYFTDGDGIYPGSKPDYETAFVFLHKTEKWSLFRLGRSGLWQSRKECVTEHEHKRGKRRDQTYLTGLQPEGCSRALYIS